MVKLLISNGDDVNAFDEDNYSPLLWACLNNNPEMVELLISNGAHVNVFDKDNCSPLLWACLNNNPEMVKLLISNGAHVNVFDKENYSPLRWACLNNNPEMVKLLISNGAEVNELEYESLNYFFPEFAIDYFGKKLFDILHALYKQSKFPNLVLLEISKNFFYSELFNDKELLLLANLAIYVYKKKFNLDTYNSDEIKYERMLELGIYEFFQELKNLDL